jgi:hypothetical protein
MIQIPGDCFAGESIDLGSRKCIAFHRMQVGNSTVLHCYTRRQVVRQSNTNNNNNNSTMIRLGLDFESILSASLPEQGVTDRPIGRRAGFDHLSVPVSCPRK